MSLIGHRKSQLTGLFVFIIALNLVGAGPLFGSRDVEESPEAEAEITGFDPSPDRSRSEEEPYYFYQGLNYGSEAMLHPIRLIVNGGYGILQIDHRTNRITDVDYQTGWRNVWQNISNPIQAIGANGWSDFLAREIVPVSINGHQAHYWPNYTQHLIGGGMSYRLYAEWFRYHHYRHPKILSGFTIAVYHMLNEVVENNDYIGWTTDPVADLLVFDPLGILLFSSDRVARFFGQALNMADWSYQPSINLSTGELENHGQNFALKWNIPRSKHWQLFYHYGTHGELGLTRKMSAHESISVAFGLKASELINLTDSVKGVNLAYSGGIFYDRNNSLLASVLFARTKDYRVRANVYPGLFRIGPLTPGFFLADRRDNGLVFGITYIYRPGLPIGIATDVH
jgi:hypothetical protein